ncbi:MAG: hypothetical protein SGJ03_09200, partial [Alphaproteobacteria bacterium]|nr:hypothetical protein [Alphaproteobacteria bacterium]
MGERHFQITLGTQSLAAIRAHALTLDLRARTTLPIARGMGLCVSTRAIQLMKTSILTMTAAGRAGYPA